jgi:hypothetical protein
MKCLGHTLNRSMKLHWSRIGRRRAVAAASTYKAHARYITEQRRLKDSSWENRVIQKLKTADPRRDRARKCNREHEGRQLHRRNQAPELQQMPHFFTEATLFLRVRSVALNKHVCSRKRLRNSHPPLLFLSI